MYTLVFMDAFRHLVEVEATELLDMGLFMAITNSHFESQCRCPMNTYTFLCTNDLDNPYLHIKVD